jgi:membrane protein required for colicin V production
MNPVDIFLLVAVLLSMVLGAWRGFLYEVLSMAGWVAAFFLASAFAHDAGMRLPMQGASETWRDAAGFLVVFVGVAFLAGFLAWLVRQLASKTGLRPVDRVLGAFFGLLRAAVWLVVLVVVAGYTPLSRNEAWVASWGVQSLGVLANQAKAWLPDGLAKVLS